MEIMARCGDVGAAACFFWLGGVLIARTGNKVADDGYLCVQGNRSCQAAINVTAQLDISLCAVPPSGRYGGTLLRTGTTRDSLHAKSISRAALLLLFSPLTAIRSDTVGADRYGASAGAGAGGCVHSSGCNVTNNIATPLRTSELDAEMAVRRHTGHHCRRRRRAERSERSRCWEICKEVSACENSLWSKIQGQSTASTSASSGWISCNRPAQVVPIDGNGRMTFPSKRPAGSC